MKSLLSIALLAVFFSSCKKDVCSGNCEDVTFSGRVVDASTQKGIGQVPIAIVWKSLGMGFISAKQTIAGAQSNSEGYFSFTAAVNKDMFDRYSLSAIAEIPNGYIEPSSFRSTQMEQVIPENKLTPSNLVFTVYPSAELAIKIANTQNDVFKRLDVHYKYTEKPKFSILWKQPPFSDTTIVVKTAADMFTTILWAKNYAPGQTTEFKDSIKCVKGQLNTFTINY